MPTPQLTNETIMAWYYSGLTAGIGLLIGLVADFVLKRYGNKLAAKTAWEGDELIIAAVAPKLPLWGLLAGIIVALPFTPLSPKLILTLHKAATVLLMLGITSAAATISGSLISMSAGGALGGASTTIFRVLAKIGVWGIGLSILLNQLGVSIAPILTALGVGGLAVALALQDTLSNLFAGIHIIISRQMKVGDYIKLDSGEEGYVTDINWRNTSVRALANNVYVIPNGKLASSIVTNYYYPEKEMSLVVQVGVAYDSDLEQVERVAIEVARTVQKEVEGAIPEFEPFIRYHTFGESAVQFSVILRIKEFVDQYLTKHEFTKRLYKRFQEEGIEIPLPQRDFRLISGAPFKVEMSHKEAQSVPDSSPQAQNVDSGPK